MKYIIEDKLLKEKKINIENEIMENKEERFRIKMSDFSGVNITTASPIPAWQNAHFHKYCKEFYAVKKGKILIVIKKDNIVTYHTLKKGDSILIDPMIEHNVYMHARAETIVVKFGDTRESDWNLAEDLDKETKEHKETM